ncbi:MAG: acyltransferase family protein [Oscillospiraceae bacterium]|jgi:peptidoglycan/LPS O-acetylase OafA/YrhL|nr:acyltransferase family protein [Oscillospiraceae bacterium]
MSANSIAASPGALQKKTRVSTVELWRYVFTLLVCWYHFEFTAGGLRQTLFTSGSSAVEFFFIIAGFTLAMSAYRKTAKNGAFPTREAAGSALDFVKKKLLAILPLLVVIIFAWALFQVPAAAGHGALYTKLRTLLNTEWVFTFLIGTPFGLNYNDPTVPMWFLTCLLAIGYIFTFLVHRFPDFMRFFAPIGAVLVYSYFALAMPGGYGGAGGTFNTLEFASLMGYMNAGMVKAVAEVCMGISVYFIYERLENVNFSAFWRVILTLLEAYAIYRFFALTLKQPIGVDNSRRLIYIMIIILTSFLNAGFLSRALNAKPLRPVWTYLGKISLAMYLGHYVMVHPYTSLVAYLKDKGVGFAQSMTDGRGGGFLFGGGATNGLMSAKDMIFFGLFMTAYAALVFGIVRAWTRFVFRPLRKFNNLLRGNA